jgi:hypothetical protein
MSDGASLPIAPPPSRRPWHARWIWAGPTALEPVSVQTTRLDVEASRRVVLFRATVVLDDAVPDRVPARVTADSRYVLWVNDVEVARGPVRSNPSLLRYDEVDLAAHLRPGPNVIAATARFYGHATPWWRAVPPTWGLGAGAFLFEAELGDRSIVSDASWKAHVIEGDEAHDGSILSALPVELVDARRIPVGWRLADYDDGPWPSAVPLAVHHIGFGGSHHPPSHPYGPLLPRPIPFLTDVRRTPAYLSLWTGAGGPLVDDPIEQVEADDQAVAPARLDLPGGEPLDIEPPAGGVAVVHVDFGEIVAGTVELEVEAPAGARFDVLFAEGANDDATLRRDEQHGGFRYVARGIDDRFETFDLSGFRYAGVSIRSEASVRLRGFTVHERIAPRADGPSFRCSDPLLDEVWRVGRRTVDLCSFDAYVDCPTREQRAWTGDAVVHQMVDLATNADWRLARWHVEMTGASARPDGMLPMAVAGDIEAADATVLPDWSLHWIRALHNLWWSTGDGDLVQSLLPVAERVLRWFERFAGADGLLHDVTGWLLADWAAVSTAGTSSVINGLWARGLRDVREMSVSVGDAGRASWAEARWQAVADAFDTFWDADRACYVDHRGGPSATGPLPVSQHGNASALVAGVVPSDRHDRLVELLTARDRLVFASWLRPGVDLRHPDEQAMYDGVTYLFTGPSSPWWDVDHQVVAAQPFFRYVVHDAVAEAGRADLVADLCRDWARLLDRCDTSLSETWFGGTHCHGWSATPTRDLVTRTLGLRPAEPGWTRARVAPRLGDLAWAEGAVPTPFGLLHARAEPARLVVDSPVAVELDLADGGDPVHLAAGAHTIPTDLS